VHCASTLATPPYELPSYSPFNTPPNTTLNEATKLCSKVKKKNLLRKIFFARTDGFDAEKKICEKSRKKFFWTGI
jgi:hypothetical protein